MLFRSELENRKYDETHPQATGSDRNPKSWRLRVRIISDGFPIDPSPGSLIPTAADRPITLKDNFIDSEN